MNEAKGIGPTLAKVNEVMHAAVRSRTGGIADYEIVVVDTDSKDGTPDIARSEGAVVVNESRRGYGRAFKTGFEAATGDIIATLDGDGTYPEDRVPHCVGIIMKEDVDFITCDRLSELDPKAMTGAHRIGNRILTLAGNLLLGVKLKDNQSGMWVFRKAILARLDLTSDGWPLSEEIKIEAQIKGCRWREIPVKYRIRLGEVKLSSWRDGWRNLKFLIWKAVNARRTGAQLRPKSEASRAGGAASDA